jgi:serine/threonine-protein kinase
MGSRRSLRKTSASDTGTPTGSGLSQSLPPELLAEASRRLGWAGLIYGCAFTVAYFGPHLYASLTEPAHRYSPGRDGLAIVAISLGFLMFGLSRLSNMRAQLLLDIGLVFSVVGSLGIAVAEFSTGFVRPGRVLGDYTGIPWECVWIVIFPLLAPNQLWKILVASLCSASMGPLTLAVVHYVFDIDLNTSALGLATYFLFSTYLCVALACVSASIIIRYGVKLKRAREVGSYQLVEPIGTGGMGEVWIARHRLLARPAAVKLIHSEVLGADRRSREHATRRFEREAQATAALGSVHTVDIYDFGVTDDGTFFYVMELLDGMSLDRLVKQFGPVSPSRAVYFLDQMCHSLAEAHERGLIHRDIKPGNIFVCRLGPDVDFIKVLDFGLVKTREADSRDPELTVENATTGTPAYMAPEVALSKKDVDARADIYALGCVTYWLLTGRPVFEAETSVATLLRHVQDEPPPLATRTSQRVPPRLEAVIRSCLSKDPDARPRDARELAAALVEAIDDPWTPEDAAAWWRSHQPPAARPIAVGA